MALQFELRSELEATVPPEARGVPRDGVAMLVSDRATNVHRSVLFSDLPELLRAGDLLVVNDSQTLPAALPARFGGVSFSLHLSAHIAGHLWTVEPRTDSALQPATVTLPGEGRAELLAQTDEKHRRLWYARMDLPVSAFEYLQRYGKPIRYSYVRADWPLEMYQTIFARKPGSAEMPSAARPFTLRTLNRLARRNISIVPITLHCGVASAERHEPPAAEWMDISPATAARINAAADGGNRTIAVGTSVVRALESAADRHERVTAFTGWTEHIVDGNYRPLAADGLLTGFHEPCASHLALLEAFCRPTFLRVAYSAAIGARMLWHEFGDVHLIL